MSAEPGQVLAGFQIERPIARGGMGEVYRARQLSLDRPVALKIIATELARDPRFAERFKREAREAARIDHPNILPVYETGEADGLVYIAMRYVNGPDLGRMLRERGRLTPHEAVEVLKPIAEALDTAHAAGVVHRDVKPANVLLERRPGGFIPFLADFGLAKRQDALSHHTATGNIVGTVDYMAPEQARGDRGIDGRVDVYAFGCMLYTALVGQVPYAREDAIATMLAHVNEPPPVPSHHVPDLPPACDKVVERAMTKDRDQRAHSAGALMRWLEGRLGPPPGSSADADASLEDEVFPDAVAEGPRFSLAAFAATVVLLAACWIGAYALGASL